MEIPHRKEIEDEFYKRMRKVSNRHQKELAMYLGDPPDPANVPIAFWQKVEKEREAELVAILLLLFIISSDEMRGYSSEPAGSFSNAKTWSSLKAKEIAKGYARNSRKALHATSHREGSREAEGIFSKHRDRMIAVTSTTQARAISAESVAREEGFASPDDYWKTEEDSRVCPICEPLNDTKRSVWSSKFPDGPPAHPICRCEIIYVNHLELAGT